MIIGLLKHWLAKSRFVDSAHYWEQRYRKGGTSGAGSAGTLARFKADFLNDFVARHEVISIIEFGCGDGQQLSLARYPDYTGVDVSDTAVAMCCQQYGKRAGFRFFPASERAGYTGRRYDLALSLDVIFHLVEDTVFDRYMRDLLTVAGRFVIIYSSNFNSNEISSHVRHRKFTDWIADNAGGWELMQAASNPYPRDAARPDETSFSDFYVFARRLG